MKGSDRSRATLAVAIVLFSIGCSATKPPSRVDDACAIFREKKGWYEEAADARDRWGVPIPIQLAFIRQESSFDGEARPPRRWYLGFIPGPRPSNAHGYAQALESTWKDYRKATGESGADRDEFGDSVDFIGWYNTRTSSMCGIAKDDAYRLYLAYHEGPTGYRRGTYRKKAWLLGTAEKVAGRARKYDSQLSRCEESLKPRKRGWFF
jgi:hypothetical protein